MPTQRTLALIKPDAVYSGWEMPIKKRYLEQGLYFATHFTHRMTTEDAEVFYKEHEGKFFFAGLVLSMVSGPLVALVIEGEDAIARVRRLNGATNPDKAEPGTLRHDFKSAGGPFNTVHGSDSPESAAREIALAEGWWKRDRE